MTKQEATDQMRYLLNEWKAIAAGSGKPADYISIPRRGLALMDYFAIGGKVDMPKILDEAAKLPIQE